METLWVLRMGGVARARGQIFGLKRAYAAAGGAWLGAGPDGERKIEGTRASAALAALLRDGAARRTPGCASPRGEGGAWAAESAETEAAAAAKEAKGSAPAGESPTSTAAQAAAILPRIRRCSASAGEAGASGSLRPAR